MGRVSSWEASNGAGSTCCSLIQTARLKGVDLQAWLADVLARINEHSARDLDALLLWNRRHQRSDQPVAEAA